MPIHSKLQNKWISTLIIFFITSFIESFTMSHVFAFLPSYLQTFHLSHLSVWIGVLNALTFIVGLPMVPYWGVWADKYGAKSIIIRSAIVEALVFALLSWGQHFYLTCLAMALVGFQLGNTGIMLSTIRSLAPPDKTGRAISIFGAASPIGMAMGPMIGGFILGTLHWSFLHLYLLDSGLSVVSACLLLFSSSERRVSRTTQTVWQSIQAAFSSRLVWIVFSLYFCFMTARQLMTPYLPLFVHQLYTPFHSEEVSIGVILGGAALIGAVVSAFIGELGDRYKFENILFVMGSIVIISLIFLSFTKTWGWFTVELMVFYAGFNGTVAMIFALLTTQLTGQTRTTALNLIYVPLYIGGIIGPIIGSTISSYGFRVQTLVAAFGCVAGCLIWLMSLKNKESRESVHPEK
ncbi:MFS transporter [Aneurinibacillus sp. Ricciae_BoGa-3]|uniref:MFS transporter n=1 Tax=Aneurinibacillus sp. Ricciae_BoGa-3 TaxID=3022697 RepID=UPI0023422D67|nr:MFS transporter [Aneurinibacillus sp. Ricciae_BoGa-3]WCK56630.1 MFS transporter [Aneurinibacillus sp. Ricciae_BoGa-3]